MFIAVLFDKSTFKVINKSYMTLYNGFESFCLLHKKNLKYRENKKKWKKNQILDNIRINDTENPVGFCHNI